MSELRTEWFAVYLAAMVQADPQKQPTSVEAALELMRRRARQISNDHGSHVEKQLMLDAMARLDQRWNHQAV
jgi:hypothetical protein